MTWNQSTIDALGRVARTKDQLTEGARVLHRQVIEARGAGASWGSIGAMLGITGEAARQKFGPKMPKRRVESLF